MKSGPSTLPLANHSGMGGAVWGRFLSCGSSPQTYWSLHDRVDYEQQQRNQPGQDQETDDGRIHITMDSLEHVFHTHLSSACTGGSCASCSFVCGWFCFSGLRGQVSWTRPIWANSTMNATHVTASQGRLIP